MKKKISKGTNLFLIAMLLPMFYLSGLNTTHASCGMWVFSWDLYDTDAVYRGEIKSKEVYKSATLLGFEDKEYTVDLEKYSIQLSEKIKGNNNSGDIIEIYEAEAGEDYPVGPYDSPVLHLFGEVGEKMIIKVDKNSEGRYVPSSQGACDSAYLNETRIDEDIESTKNSINIINESNMTEEQKEGSIRNYQNEIDGYYSLKAHINNLFGSNKLTESMNSTFKDYIYDNFLNGVDIGYSKFVSMQAMSIPHYHSDRETTRAEFVSILARAFDYKLELDSSGDYPFPDVDYGLEYPYPDSENIKFHYPNGTRSYIRLFHEKGIIGGYSDGTFRPNGEITRAEASKVLINVLRDKELVQDGDHSHNFSDVDEDNKFIEFISILNTLEIDGEKVMKGYSDGEFKPENNITRGQTNKITALSRKI